MKKRASLSLSKTQREKIERDLTFAEGNALAAERNGQTDTYWHTKAARLRAALEDSKQGATKKSEVKDNGPSD